MAFNPSQMLETISGKMMAIAIFKKNATSYNHVDRKPASNQIIVKTRNRFVCSVGISKALLVIYLLKSLENP